MTAATAPQAGYRVHAWGENPVWEEFERAASHAGEVEVAVEACGVGRTVLNCIAGDLADERATLPVVPGHEVVGRVIAVGDGVDPALVGRRVVAYFYRFCGACPECSAGRQPRCADLDGWVGVHSGGGYAPFAVLPARNALVIGDDVDPVDATVIADAVATPVHVCATRAGVTANDRVVVIGAGGGVGAHMIQVAAVFGGRVAGLDVTDEKLALVDQLGAVAVDSGDLGLVDPDALWSDGAPTVVIDLVGSAASLTWAAAALGMGGRLVVLTTFPGHAAAVEPRALVAREMSIIGSRYASVADVLAAATLVRSGQVRPIIGAVVDAPSVAGVHDALRAGTLVGRGAIVW